MPSSALPAYLHDPVLEGYFGSFEMPSLKPRPGAGQGLRARQRPAHSRPAAGGRGSDIYGLMHNALLTHQAVVKVVRGGGVASSGRLGGQLSYITRAGSLDLECCNDGVVYQGIEGEEGYRAVQSDWEVDFAGMDPRVTAYTYHVIVSYPKDTDREAAKVAAREFAGRLTGGDYGDYYKCVLAHHGDTAYPHTHIVVNRAGANGRTLHLSPHGVDIQMLRDLHVETAREVGVVLNATSRFSRGVDHRPRSLGRIHAERAGRMTGPRSGKAGLHVRNWPFHGAARRVPLEGIALENARRGRARKYECLVQSQQGLGAITAAAGRGEVRPDGIWKIIENATLLAATVLARGGILERRNTVMEQQVESISPEQAGLIEAEFKAINEDIRVFFDGMASKLEKISDEEQRSKGEVAYAHALRGYEPLMDAETRSLFGKRLERDHGEVEHDDPDPVRQRRGALEDAADPRRTAPLGEAREIGNDARGTAVRSVLTEADKEVVARFEKIGMNGNLALSRIRNGADVDRETRNKWFVRDVSAHANARSLSDSQAGKEVAEAYRDAAMIYRAARSEIRGINRGFHESTREVVSEHTNMSRTQNKAQDRAPPESRVPASVTLAPAGKESAPLDLEKGIRGMILAKGEEQFDPKDKESLSPYLDLKVEGYTNPKRIWGVALPDVLERRRLDVGDTATFIRQGKETVTVTKTDPETGHSRKINVTRNKWDAQNLDRAVDRDKDVQRARDREREEWSKGDRGFDR